MNIFVTDEDPVLCAQNLDDKRVGNLLMEANQMLSLAVKTHHSEDPRFLGIDQGQLTRGFAHQNSPISLWVRHTRGNFDWTAAHARALAAEFKHRFGKEHASAFRTDYISRFAGHIPAGQLTDFQNSAKNSSLGIDFSWLEPVTEAYRQYLRTRWPSGTHAPKWTNRGQPEWYMKLGDQIIIGYLAVGEPVFLGSLTGHGLPEDLALGASVLVNGKLFTFNVSYVPNNPKREQLVPILVPKERLEDDFWTGSLTKAEEKPKAPPAEQEEFPF